MINLHLIIYKFTTKSNNKREADKILQLRTKKSAEKNVKVAFNEIYFMEVGKDKEGWNRNNTK